MSFDSLKNKVVLVTGATGSFGQRFITRLLEDSDAKKIIIFSRDELKQSEMQTKFRGYEDRLRFFLGDVRDVDRLQRAFDGVDVVVHAAALKQVPALEYNPFEAIKTNVLGTQNVITAALDQGVEKVVLISTDKAANPANLYGATKLCAEKLVVSSNYYSGNKNTRFSVVRYGNVFGSRGSLIKVLEDQKKTGKVNLTHEDMTRFWITLDQGIELVMLALDKMHGGEVFIPKVPSMKVKDMIQKLAPGCEINVVGIRPGEKIHEVLITPEEARHTKEFKDFYVIIPESDWWKRENHQDGKDLPVDFYFSSLNNTWWLDEKSFGNLLNSIL
ncbi:MAG: UDP-N-acetylglucosamine 4,6-dehydratase (inverting) [Candidatus Magasanikbacteria bacterium]|nr:UDP-N-acetylglucosamine 4,6-dehydratase (inverting) [Candidatus Magasanikbacteria bacterium]